MDTLGSMMVPTKTAENPGRPKELKSYILESNSDLQPNMEFAGFQGFIDDTGIDSLKILTVQRPSGQNYVQFYLDLTDPLKRFLILHTNFDAEETQSAIQSMTNSNNYEFDNAWLWTSALKFIAKKIGNRRIGYKIGYKDIFQESGPEEILPDNDITLEGSGGISNKLLQLAENDPSMQRTLGYERVRISRGSINNGILTDLSFDGRFIVRKGRSIGDQMVLVEGVKDDYANFVGEVEALRLRAEKKNSHNVISGSPFEFEFTREVDDWEKYLSRIFNGREPFRVWGIKSKIRDGYYRVLGVDMHTGHPLDIEATNHLFRVYLPKESCGNVILRLFVNLQRSFDSTITCKQLVA